MNKKVNQEMNKVLEDILTQFLNKYDTDQNGDLEENELKNLVTDLMGDG